MINKWSVIFLWTALFRNRIKRALRVFWLKKLIEFSKKKKIEPITTVDCEQDSEQSECTNIAKTLQNDGKEIIKKGISRSGGCTLPHYIYFLYIFFSLSAYIAVVMTLFWRARGGGHSMANLARRVLSLATHGCSRKTKDGKFAILQRCNYLRISHR